MAVDRLGFAEEAICPIPVLSVAPILRQIPYCFVFLNLIVYDANLASLRNFSPHCRRILLKSTRLRKKMKILCLPRLTRNSGTPPFQSPPFSPVFQIGVRILCMSIHT